MKNETHGIDEMPNSCINLIAALVGRMMPALAVEAHHIGYHALTRHVFLDEGVVTADYVAVAFFAYNSVKNISSYFVRVKGYVVFLKLTLYPL